MKTDLIGIFLVAAIPFAIPFASCAGACDHIDQSKAALDSAGVSGATITGHSLMGCGKEDMSSVNFKGTNANGKPVTGVVCCGLWKSCTVRW